MSVIVVKSTFCSESNLALLKCYNLALLWLCFLTSLVKSEICDFLIMNAALGITFTCHTALDLLCYSLYTGRTCTVCRQ